MSSSGIIVSAGYEVSVVVSTVRAADLRGAPTVAVTSGKSVVSEVWVAMLVVHSHDDELSVCGAVTHGVRKSGGGALPFDDVALVVVDRGCPGVGSAASRCDCCANGRNEPVAQPRLLLLVPFPSADDVFLGERVEPEGQTHERWRYARRSSMRETRWSHVTSPASPESSIVARRSVSADHSWSTSASSTLSESRLASRPEASNARSSSGSVSACSRRVSAAAVTIKSYLMPLARPFRRTIAEPLEQRRCNRRDVGAPGLEPAEM